MRIITEKDKDGLVEAIRVFCRKFTDERLKSQTMRPIIDRALDAGLSMDILLNSVNWLIAKDNIEELTLSGFIDFLIENPQYAVPLKLQDNWFKPVTGFDLVNEAVHDFFLSVTGKGGKWNNDSNRRNLANVIEKYNLEAILSEELINEIIKTNPDLNSFTYIATIAKDFNSLPVVMEPTEAEELYKLKQQEMHKKEKDTTEHAEVVDTGGSIKETAFAEQKENADDLDNQPEDDVYEIDPETAKAEPSGLESTVFLSPDPKETKKDCLKMVLRSYTPNELIGIVRTIENGMDLSLDEIIEKLANGQFDVKKEDSRAQEIHQAINSDLIMSFIDCVNINGEEMDEEMAKDYDILHDSWDLRAPEVKKYHKLLRLIYTEGKDDPDLIEAAADIERLYVQKD